MPKKKRLPVDPRLRALAYGLDGTEDKALILALLTWLVPANKKAEHEEALRKELAEDEIDARRLVPVLWTIVKFALPTYQARGHRENAAERAEWKRFATDRRTIDFLRWLAREPDDVFWEHTGPSLCRAADRLDVLRRNPFQWVESWITPPDLKRARRRPKSGNPYLIDVKPEATRLLAEAGYKELHIQLRYLRLLGIEPPRGRHRF